MDGAAVRVIAAAPPVLPRAVMAGALLCVAIGSLDQGIVNTSLPRIASGFGALPHLSWIVTAFMLTSTVTTPVYGTLGGIVGRRRMLLVSLLLFTGGSLLCGMAWSMATLILFRGLQGLGSGGLIALALAIVAGQVPRHERAGVQGVFSAVMAACGVAGPLLGGLITAGLSWRWTFYVNLPLGIVAMVLIAMLPPDPGRQERFDWIGTVLMAAATTALLVLFSLDNRSAVALQWGLSGAVLILVLGTIGWEIQTPISPVLAVDLCRDRTMGLLLPAITLQVGAISAVGVALPLLFQLELGMGTAGSGLMLVPQTGAMIAASILSGRMARTGHGARALLVAALGVAGAATLALALCVGTTPRVAAMAICMMLLGAGFGISFPGLVGMIQNAAVQHQLTRATSLMMFMRWLGASAGVALSGRLLVAWLPAGADAAGVDRLASGSDAVLAGAYRTGLVAIFAVNGMLFLLAALLVRLSPPSANAA